MLSVLLFGCINRAHCSSNARMHASVDNWSRSTAEQALNSRASASLYDTPQEPLDIAQKMTRTFDRGRVSLGGRRA